MIDDNRIDEGRDELDAGNAISRRSLAARMRAAVAAMLLIPVR